MSRTDKDRPYWVATIQDGNGAIDHDHRNGVCIEETLESSRFFNGHWGFGRHHRSRTCKKRVTVTTYCYKSEPNRFYSWRNKRYVQTCWKWEYKCTPDPDEFHSHFYCERDYYVECIGHDKHEFHNEIPCHCDDFPVRPTCDLTAPDNSRDGWRRYTWGGVPTWYCREVYHRPERARERKLNDMAREYNTYGDIEDDDFVNRQARNSARWLWW